MKEKKLTQKEKYIMRFITDIEILAIETEQLLEGIGTNLKLCQSWDAIKCHFNDSVRSVKINLDSLTKKDYI